MNKPYKYPYSVCALLSPLLQLLNPSELKMVSACSDGRILVDFQQTSVYNILFVSIPTHP